MPSKQSKLDIFKNSLRVEIYSCLKKLYPDPKAAFDKIEIDLKHPKEKNYGDYSSTICLKISKILNKNPIEIANQLKVELEKNKVKLTDLGIAKIKVEPPGFLNFHLSEIFFINQLKEVLDNPENFDKIFVSPKNLEDNLKKQSKDIKLDQKKQKIRLMIEFGHPNTHKEFHIGHLRNITIAESLIRLLENLNIEVIRVNYQGDVGMHIAKCLWSILQNSRFKIQNSKLWNINRKVEFLAKAYAQGNKAYEENEQAKKEIIKINRKIYDDDPQILPLWKETRQWSLDYFEAIYKRLGTYYHRYYFESEVYKSGKELVKKYLKTGVFEKSQKAIIFPGQKYGLHNRVFITSEDFPTYEAKDIGLAVLQFKEYQPDLIIHVVGPEQAGYFQVVFEALDKILPGSKNKELHFIYGWVQLKEGKMSSRKGNVVTAYWLLDQAKKKAAFLVSKEKHYPKKEIEKITETVALSAVKYSMLKFSSRSDILFDFNESVSLEGDSGPYLLYTYTRCQSLLKKLKAANNNKNPAITFKNKTLSFNTEELALLRTIYQFPEITLEAGINFAPNILCAFLFDLAQKYNLFYDKHPILNPPNHQEQTKQFRLALTVSVAVILKKGLFLLGMPLLDRM